MPFPRLGGSGLPLNLVNAIGSQQPIGTVFGTAGPTNVLTLPAASAFTLPAGTYLVAPGGFTSLQFNDPVAGQWRTINADNSFSPFHLDSDGTNVRLANLTGTPVGAIITNAGAASTYTNGIGSTATGCTITVSSGASTWVPVVGGAINSTVTVTTTGSGYLFPPLLIFSAPPAGGIQASGIAVLTSGGVSSVTVTNQGAGYTTAPTITVVNDPRDTAGSGAVLTVNATLVSSGQLTALYPLNFGNAVTGVPTFTFSPASTTAATMVMNFVVTSFSITTSGAGYTTGATFVVMGNPTLVGGTRASNVAGPISDTSMTFPRPAWITGTANSAGAIATTGSVVVDNGFGFQAVPAGIVLNGGTGVVSTQGVVTLNVGGITDTSYIQPF